MLDELLRDVQDKNVPVSNLLRRAKVLAHKLDDKEFLKWIDDELNGYAGKEVRDYRMVHGQLKALNPYRGWMPVMFQDSEIENTVSQRGSDQSVIELEELLTSGRHEYEMPYPDHIAAKMIKDAPMQMKVALIIPSTSLVGILNTVRNRLFDWLLQQDGKNTVEKDSASTTESQRDELSFDAKTSVLIFKGKSIEISKTKNSDPHYLLAVIFKDKDRVWAYDEIWEDPYFGRNHTGYNPKKDRSKIYNAAYSVNEKVAKATTVQDFLDITTTTVAINKDNL